MRPFLWLTGLALLLAACAAPAGTPDHCNPDPNGPTPENPGWADCPHRPLLAWGLHPEASDRLRCAGIDDAGSGPATGVPLVPAGPAGAAFAGGRSPVTIDASPWSASRQ